MKGAYVKRHGCALVIAVMAALGAANAQAQTLDTRGCGTATSSALKATIHGVTRIPDRTSLGILSLGAAAAFGAHAADTSVTRSLRNDRGLHEFVEPGATIGGMPFEVGAAAAITSLGSELLQAQLIGAAWTIGLKEVTRRSRPEGTGFSFPSGHTATAFASATVLQRRFGWKAGIPAYAVAGYVGLSRIQMQRHYLSDVAFGAALGIVAGRNVSIGHGHQLSVGPLVSDSGSGIGFSLVRKK
jgi:hypothetical protein